MGDSTVGAEEEAKEEKDKSGKAKGKGERRKTRRGGRRNPQKERKLTTKDTGLRSLLVIMLKLLAQNSQQLRTVRAATTDTFLVKKEHIIYRSLEEEGRAFAKAVADWRLVKADGDDMDRRPPGPPTPSVFMRLLEELAKLDVGGKNKKIIEEEIGRLESAGEDAPNQLDRGH